MERDFEYYIKVRDLLISRGKMSPLEAMLYERCFAFFKSCAEDGKGYYIDQLEVALFFRVSRKTAGKMIKSLTALGLFKETGYKTINNNKYYTVIDWELIKNDVLLDDADYTALVQGYADERQTNKAQLMAYKATVAALPETLPETLPEALQDVQSVEQAQSHTEPALTISEAVQEVDVEKAIKEYAIEIRYKFNTEGAVDNAKQNGVEMAMCQMMELMEADKDSKQEKHPNKWSY